MTAQDRASDRFRRLIEAGRRIVSAAGWDGDNYQRFCPSNDYFCFRFCFRTEAMTLVRRTCGQDSDHYRYRELQRLAEAKAEANRGLGGYS